MGKRLIVAEKPSVGRDIANVLNCRENRKGCRIGADDIVTWAVGHLVGLCNPEEINDKYKDWNLKDLPVFPRPFPLKVLENRDQFEIVKSLMLDPEVDRIVCATDAGREGELIFRYIYQLAGCNKPVERLWISSLTYRAIKEGFENLKPSAAYDDLYESARCRSEADWLIGMNGSRAFAIVNKFRGLSIGRVQSPTLAILVKRELERRNFVPETYCEVVAHFDDFDGYLLNPEAEDNENTHFPIDAKDSLEAFLEKCSTSGCVCDAENEAVEQPPQQLYDLTSLQRDANRIFGMSSQWTLDTAQSLYEKHKAITYPRTDSRFLSSDLKATLPKRLEHFRTGELAPFAEMALQSERDLFGRFISNKGVTDHHAIIPTGEAKNKESWSKAEKQIYDLIARRFIGMFFPDKSFYQQTLKIDISGKTFLSKGVKVIEAGWGAVDTSRMMPDSQLPDLDAGDRVDVLDMDILTDQTKPPAPHTEASLLLAMEHAGKYVEEDSEDDKETEFGIGTPATRAAMIEKLIDKGMARRSGRVIRATELGIELVGILPEVLQSPEMTGEWEARLSRIGKGKESPDVFMKDICTLTEEIVQFAVEKGDTGIRDIQFIGTCPLCGNKVREYDKAYYCINKSCGFRRIYKVIAGVYPTLKPETMRELLKNKIAPTEKGTYTIINEAPYIAFTYGDPANNTRGNDPVIDLIKDSGFEFVDKRRSGGSLWIIASKEEGTELVEKCKKHGVSFAFSTKGGRSSKYRPAWFSK